MDRQKLTHHELNSALRAGGCACVEEVHLAVLEIDGQITVQPRAKPGAAPSAQSPPAAP